MSSMAKAARAAMKAKASRMGGKGEPKAKVDASTWSPPEMMNTGMKTGMRPLTRRAFKKGGKVIEKCEGGPAAMRADRKMRKAGGRSLVTDLINRNVKKANKAREGGDAHVGGYAKGGDVEQDKKLIKKALRQHDKNMHGGKHEEIKLKKGGYVKKQAGGAAAEPKYEDYKSLQTGKGPAQGEGDRTSPPGGTQMPRDTKKKHGGGTYYGGTRPTGGRMPKATGGRSTKADKARKAVFDSTRSWQSTHQPRKDDDTMKNFGDIKMTSKNEGFFDLGGLGYDKKKATGGRAERKSGGRAKGKTNIIISINAQKPDQQAMMPKMPTPPPMPVPPVAPPLMGAGAPPMPMPPAPPPGLAGGAPGGMPPLPRKRGGRTYRSYKDMDAGALSGMGRLEKTEIEHGKRVGRLSGGRARSYKDMDAGALSGMGRIEKTAIQKHKR